MVRSIKVRFEQNKKGRQRIRTTTKVFKKTRRHSLELANLARKQKHIKTVKNRSLQSPECTKPYETHDREQSPTTIASEFFNSTTIMKLTGATYNNFMENRLDFRHWGTRTYQGFIEAGAKDDLLGQLDAYESQKNKLIAHQIIVCPDELPLNATSTTLLTKMVIALVYMLERMDQVGCITAISKEISHIIKYSDTLVRAWTLQFIHNCGMLCNVGYKQRTPEGLIRDTVAVDKMRTWMINASKGQNAATSTDFVSFIDAEFGTHISDRTARVWLRICGFSYKRFTTQQVYIDGHNRPDVQQALKKYIAVMQDLREHCVAYTGEYMETEIKGARLVDPAVKRCVISYHDECSAHSNECNNSCWMMNAHGGQLPPKSRGICRMVAGYCCADIGNTRIVYVN